MVRSSRSAERAAGVALRALLALSACWLVSCRQSRSLPADPLFVRIDGLTPANGFGSDGTLFVGDGWGKAERHRPLHADWGSMAWVTAREAVLHVPTVDGVKVDFFARALPYPWAPGSPTQEMEVAAAGRIVARLPLPQRWANLRVPLPDDFSTGRLEKLQLRFSHALPANQGAQRLAAAFTQVAIVPRSVETPASFLRSQLFDAMTARATVPAHGALVVPLPAETRVRLRLAGTRSACETCEVSVELGAPSGGRRTLWHGTPQAASEVDLGFDTPGPGLSRLWLGVSGGQGAHHRPVVEFALGQRALRVTGRRARRPRPDVFIYLIDTLRADALAPYGGDPKVTPAMNGFSKDAVTYTQARAAASWTLPSVVSLLTGQYADRHGVMTGLKAYEPQRLTSIAIRLAAHGYQNVGISHTCVISSPFGSDAGFQSFFLSNHLNGWQLRSGEASRLLAEWLLRQDGLSPRFTYIHTVDPHGPYSPPEAPEILAGSGPLFLQDFLPEAAMEQGHARHPERVRTMHALYTAEVNHADQEFGRFLALLKWLGLYESSFIVLVGDHGEEFAEHGGFGHGRTLFDELLRVPMLIKFPQGRWAGRTVHELVSLVDVAPTLLSNLGALEDGDDFDGEVLAPGPPERKRGLQAVFFEVANAGSKHAGHGVVDLRGAVAAQLKCIENLGGVDRFGDSAPALMGFDLATDPLEAQSALSPAMRSAAACRRLLDGRAAARVGVARQRSQRATSPEAVEQLRALGYVQ